MSCHSPKKKVHAVEDVTTANRVGSQDTTMVGAIGSSFDLGSVSEGITGVPSVHEGEIVDIEVDSGAEVSCLPARVGADTYPLQETRLGM